MIANMNEKGRQTKLLAAFAILAMVVCAFAVAMPSDNVEAVDMTTPTAGVTGQIDDYEALAAIADKTDGIYVLSDNIGLDAAAKIPAGVTVYTNGYNISTGSGTGHVLTVNGTLYVNGVANEADGSAVTFADRANLTGTGTIYIGKDSIIAVGPANLVNGTSSLVTISAGTAAVTNFQVTAEKTSGFSLTLGDGFNEATATINGDYEVGKNTALTVAQKAKVTVGPSGTITNKGTIVNNGTIDAAGKAVTNNGTITNNGLIQNTNNLSNTGKIDGVQTNYTLYATLADAVKAYPNATYRIYGDSSEGTPVSITVPNSANDSKSIILEPGAKYTGIYTYTVTGVGEVSVNISAENTTDAAVNVITAGYTYTAAVGTDPAKYAITFAVAGGDLTQVDEYYTSSMTSVSAVSYNVTSTVDAIADNTTIGVTLNNVAFQDANLTVPVTVTGNSMVPAGSSLTFSADAAVTVSSGATFTIIGDLFINNVEADNRIVNGAYNSATYGTVYTNSLTKVTPYATDDSKTYLVLIDGTTITTGAQFVEAALAGMDMTLGVNIVINSAVSIDGLTIDMAGFQIHVGVKDGFDYTQNYNEKGWVYTSADANAKLGTFTMNGVTINSGVGEVADDTGCISVNGSSIDVTNSKIFAVVTTDSKSTVEVSNEQVTYDNTASIVRVGWMTDFTFSGNASENMYVYGNLVVTSNVSLPVSSEIVVYNGGTLTVDGTITIAGNAVFHDGSKTVINGTFNVTNNNGGASVVIGKTAGADFLVSEGATMNVNGTSNTIAAVNTLTINNAEASYTRQDGWSERFLVEGTLNIDGTFSGRIYDSGVVDIDGAVAKNGSAYVYLGDAVSITVGSVTGGNLYITDAQATAESAIGYNTREGIDGNQVVLKDVNNVTVDVTVNSVSYKVGEKNFVGYYTVMDVSGTATAVTNKTGSIGIAAKVGTLANNEDVSAYVTITDDVTIGQNMTLNVTSGRVYVDGTVNAVTAANPNTGAAASIINNTARITVNGTITVLEGNYTGNGQIDAAKRAVTATVNGISTTTEYYTGFAAAVAAGLDADDDTITLMGYVTADADVTIPVGLTVSMQNGSTLYVADEATVTLTNGAMMNGLSATVEVDGTFIAQNEPSNLFVDKVIADVLIDESPMMTWTSLANALAGAQPGDVITLNQAIVIDEDVTIPEGVTVNTNQAPVASEDYEGVEYSILVVDATLTVDGTLSMGTAANGSIVAYDDKDEAAIDVNGVFSASMMGYDDNSTMNATVSALDGAHFGMISGATTTYYVSNLAFAATTTAGSENVLSEKIDVKGGVSAGDVTFTAGDLGLAVNVIPNGKTTSVVAVGTVTLDGVQLNIEDNTRFTGSVAMASGETTANVALKSAYKLVLESASDDDGTYAYISGDYAGTVTIAAGTVTVYSSAADNVTGLSVPDQADALTVASGATLALPRGAALDAGTSTDGQTVVVDGTLYIRNASALNGGEIIVNGNVDTEDLTLDTVLRIVGTMTIAADDELTIADGGKLILGEAPTVLGGAVNAAVTGDVTIQSGGYILAYNGAGITEEQINWNDVLGTMQAEFTTYHINETAYATVYSVDGITINSIFSATAEKIELTGWETNYDWYPADSTTKVAAEAAIGTPENVYAEFEPSTVKGVVTVGAGVNLYIDGLQVTGYTPGATMGGEQILASNLKLEVGTHKVTYEIKAGWDGSSVTLTWNGVAIENGATITVTADMTEFTLSATGATNSTGVSDGGSTGGDDGMGLTDYLLIVLVVLIVVMAIMVALRLMRS